MWSKPSTPYGSIVSSTASCPKLVILPGKKKYFHISPLSNVSNVLQATQKSQHAGWCGAGRTRLPSTSRGSSRCSLQRLRDVSKHTTSPVLGKAYSGVETARYLVVTLDTRLTSWAYVNQVGKMVAQRLGVHSPLLSNKRSCLSIRNGVLLYMKLIRPCWTTHSSF
jgi:hypothetical protein